MKDTELTMESNNVVVWLEKIGLGVYKNNFIAEGYDDLIFLLEFNDTKIDELLGDVDMTKKGHIMKFRSEIEKKKAEQKKESVQPFHSKAASTQQGM